MKRIKVQIDGVSVEWDTADNWDDLTFEDLPFAAQLIFNLIDPGVAKVELFKQLCRPADEKSNIKSLIDKLWLEDQDNCLLLFDQVDFVSKTLPNFYASKVNSIRGFQGPENGMRNLKWQQFRMAEPYYADFVKTKDVGNLNALIGYLYWQEEFRIDRAHLAAKQAASWPMEERLAILLNYSGLRHHVMDVQEKPEESEDEDLEEDRDYSLMDEIKRATPQDTDWTNDIIYNLSDGGKFGSFMDIDNLMVPAVLEAMVKRNELIEKENARYSQ